MWFETIYQKSFLSHQKELRVEKHFLNCMLKKQSKSKILFSQKLIIKCWWYWFFTPAAALSTWHSLLRKNHIRPKVSWTISHIKNKNIFMIEMTHSIVGWMLIRFKEKDVCELVCSLEYSFKVIRFNVAFNLSSPNCQHPQKMNNQSFSNFVTRTINAQYQKKF